MRVAYIGNFGPERSTENAVAYGLEQHGVDVERIPQERASATRPNAFARQLLRNPPDLVLYTRSHNRTALPADWTRIWRLLEDRGVRTASVHLDVFVGVRRDGIRRDSYRTEPLFTTQTVLTPDPELAAQIETSSTRHVWLPPAADVRHDDAAAVPSPTLAGQVVFVGSRYGVPGLHPEYPFRAQLLDALEQRYGERFVWIGNGSPIGTCRGPSLWSVYASDCVIVGDSCFAGDRPLYWSDRVPETLARGGLLIHPDVPGIRSYHAERILTYLPKSIPDLFSMIDECLASMGQLVFHREKARQQVLAFDTYVHRARRILDEALA